MRQLGLNQPITSYSGLYNPKVIEQLGQAAEGIIATSLAPGVGDLPAVAEYVERWKKEEKRDPNGLPYTQYLHDAPYMVAAILTSMDKKGTGPNRRKFPQRNARAGDLRSSLDRSVTVSDSHTVSKPVYLVEVKGGKWTAKDVAK